MSAIQPESEMDAAVRQLNESYYAYLVTKRRVTEFGEAIVGPLLNALNNKWAHAVVEALD